MNANRFLSRALWCLALVLAFTAGGGGDAAAPPPTGSAITIAAGGTASSEDGKLQLIVPASGILRLAE